jgi:ribosomal protein S13
MVLYLKTQPKNLLDFRTMFSKVAGYKINTQKSVAFLYPNSEQSEKEIRKTKPFTITSKKLKHLGINLTKEVTDTMKINNHLKKETNEDIRRWKNIPCSWISRIL